jgi:hypothetical protein
LACKLMPAKPWLRLWPGLRSFERESHGPRPSGQANARISLTSVDSEGFQCRLAALSPRQNIALPRNASDIHHPCTSTRFRNAVAVRVGLPSVGLRHSPHHLLPPHTTLVFAKLAQNSRRKISILFDLEAVAHDYLWNIGVAHINALFPPWLT